jgi:hypothetical protein
MNPFQLYIGVSREVRKFKDDLDLTSADITYWLNKAVDNIIDSRLETLDKDDDTRHALNGLTAESLNITPDSSSSIYDNHTGYTFLSTSLPSDVRNTLRELATIDISGVSKTVNVKPISQDKLNIKFEDPYSEHKLRLGRANPLLYKSDTNTVLVSTTDYTITDYSIFYIKNNYSCKNDY